MMMPVLEFLSAYYPRYLCPPCLANLMDEVEFEVQAALVSAPGLEFARANCMNCRDSTHGVRFRSS
jgi:hypothetical protein